MIPYGFPKETVTAIMMLYRNTKVKVSSSDEDTDIFAIVARVLLGDTLTLYIFIICLDYVTSNGDISNRRKWHETKKACRITTIITITFTCPGIPTSQILHTQGADDIPQKQ